MPPTRSASRPGRAPGLRHPYTRAVICALLAPAVVAAWGASPAMAESAPPEGAEIRDLQVRNNPNDIFISFELTGAFTDEILEQIDSGLPVTFRHYVEIIQKRTAWFDHTLVKKVISSTVTYDTLTRQYRLTRSVDGEVMDTSVTERREEMERFMAGVERQRICDPGELPGDTHLALRVKSRIRRRFVFFFIPWNFETSWARVGLTLPAQQTAPDAAGLPR